MTDHSSAFSDPKGFRFFTEESGTAKSKEDLSENGKRFLDDPKEEQQLFSELERLRNK